MSAKPAYDLKHPSGALENGARRKFAKTTIETGLSSNVYENLRQIQKSTFVSGDIFFWATLCTYMEKLICDGFFGFLAKNH